MKIKDIEIWSFVGLSEEAIKKVDEALAELLPAKEMGTVIVTNVPVERYKVVEKDGKLTLEKIGYLERLCRKLRIH